MNGGAPDVIEARAESCYNMALEMIAMGETRAATKGAALVYDISIGRIDLELRHALRDAMRQGVEREDIDPSWFAR